MSEGQSTENRDHANVVDLDKERNARTITRADLFKKANQVEYVYFERAGGKLAMRRLTTAELEEIEQIQTEGVTLEGDQVAGQKQQSMKMKVNVRQSASGEAYARRVAVAKSLSVEGEKYTAAEIGDMPDSQLVRDIAVKVFELSGANPEQLEAAKRARPDAGGGEGSDDDNAGGDAAGG